MLILTQRHRVHEENEIKDNNFSLWALRVRAKITSHSLISFSDHLCPIFIHRILNAAGAGLPVRLNQVDQI